MPVARSPVPFLARLLPDGFAALSRLVLGPDPERQLNLKITLGGQLGYVGNLLLIWYFARNGLMDPALAWPVSLAVFASMFAFYMLLRLGWSRRFADPSLTVPQMINASLFSAVGYMLAPQVHIALLMPVAVTLAYSVFALRGRQVVIVQASTIAIFVAASTVMCALQPEYYAPVIEVCVIGMLAMTVVMLTWAGSRVADLRARQRRQREALAETLERIEVMAESDGLTGLPNRRRMNALLARHADQAQRGGRAIVVALVDLDHFKQVNDTHGHAVGDEVLRTFARVAQASLPSTDVMARWGGEEFLLLSMDSMDEVVRRLEMLRQTLQGPAGHVGVPDLMVRFSAGVAQHQPGLPVDDTVGLADEALYAAKGAGRSQTRVDPGWHRASRCSSTRPRAGPAVPGAPGGPSVACELATPEFPENGYLPRTSDGEDSTLTDEGRDMPPDGRHSWVRLLGEDARHRASVARTLMGFPPYLLSLVGVIYLWRTGYLAGPVARTLVAGLFLTPLLWYVAVRAGWTRRLRDPAIAPAHVVLGTLWCALLYATTQQAHAIQLIALVMVMAVAVCNMDKRQAWLACAFAMALMSGVIAVMTHWQPDVYNPRAQVAHWILLMVDLPTLVVMGGQLDKMRRRMRSQRAELRGAVARLSELAIHDELTGLINRTHMTQMLAHHSRRNVEAGTAFTLTLIDLDHFKQINDRHGHAVGDLALRRFAALATDTLRQIDLVARWGGEEFLVLCPGSRAEQTRIAIDRLRKALAELEISPDIPQLRVTLSAGIAVVTGGESADSAVANADAALYAAKKSGRDRVCVFEAAG